MGSRSSASTAGFAARSLVLVALAVALSQPGPSAAATSAAADLSTADLSTAGADPTWAFSDRYPVEITVSGEEQARLAVDQGVDVDDVRLPDGPYMPGIVRASVNDRERAALEDLGFRVAQIRNEAKEMFLQVRREWEARGVLEGPVPPPAAPDRAWPSYAELQAELQAVAAAHPELCRLYSLGNSIQGRALWIMKISDNPEIEEAEPEFKFSSSIHGNEPVGMELCRRMIHYLVDNYGVDPRVTSMVDGAELWLAPLHNPDGYFNGTRYNAHGVDLNRNFPDPVTDPHDDPTGREIENQHYMNFGYVHNFILSANYHTGALVMNIPWDCRHAETPDHDMIWNIAEGYSSRNPPMWNSPEFYHGVTLGADWYVIHGGMQDWCYNWRNEIDITIECSNTSWPNWSQMDAYWNDNREAMLYYMERVTVMGVEGVVTDALSGLPLAVKVDVTQIGKEIYSDADVGDYHRLLLSGTYTLVFSKPGYNTQTIPNVRVLDSAPTYLDVAMMPVSSAVEDGQDGRQADGYAGLLGRGTPLVSVSEPMPNPTAGPVRVGFRVSSPALVTVAVYDIAGREVRSLGATQGSPAAGGAHEIAWDGRDSSGRPVRSGLYFLRIAAGRQAVSRAVVVGR